VGLVVVCAGPDFTAAGHFVALLLGILLSVRFGAVARWTRVRVALLAVGASFGYLLLVNTEPSVVVAPLVGVAGALGAHWLVGRFSARPVRAPLAVAGPSTT
jgi:hypothetical protein